MGNLKLITLGRKGELVVAPTVCVIFLVRLYGKFEIDHSGEKGVNWSWRQLCVSYFC